MSFSRNTSLETDRKLFEATERRNSRIAPWEEIKGSITSTTLEGLAPIDQLHSGGLSFTRILARMAQIRPGDSVLDVGCGAGGPARVLASEMRADVTGIDITAGLIDLAQRLGEVTNIPVKFQQGDALNLPFKDQTFDLVWTQHAAGTIADKKKFYSEMRRVLKHGGRLAMHDLVKGPATGPLHMPIPCADSEDITFVLSPADLKNVLAALGFREVEWRDFTKATIAWFDKLPPAGSFSIRLIKGERFPEMVENLKRNLQEARMGVTMAVFAAV
jgi:SAM-dependent methyltransferase